MKKLSQRAEKIFNKIIELAKQTEHCCIKIDTTDGAFMPLSVEKIDQDQLGEYWSFCHYGMQNGDCMRDPEVIFWITENGIFPTYFRNDYIGRESYCVQNNGGQVSYYKREQRDLATFSNQWMENIKNQQDLNAVKILELV